MNPFAENRDNEFNPMTEIQKIQNQFQGMHPKDIAINIAKQKGFPPQIISILMSGSNPMEIQKSMQSFLGIPQAQLNDLAKKMGKH